MNSKNKGDLSESIIISEFLRLGIPVSLPFGDNESYDLIIDIDGNFKSVQVKTGRLKDGFVTATICNSVNTKNLVKEKQKKESYKGKVDFIAIYCDDLKSSFLIDPFDFGETIIHLRINKTKNNQSKNINWAKNYILKDVINRVVSPHADNV